MQFVPDEVAEDADAMRAQLEACVCATFHNWICRRCEIALARLDVLTTLWPFLKDPAHLLSLASSSLCR